MFLRIVGARSAEQFDINDIIDIIDIINIIDIIDIIEVKIPFDFNII